MKLGSIQMLRALAAIMVVFAHTIVGMGRFAVGWLQHTPVRTSLGIFGVDLFFVISGFVIYRSAGGLTGTNAAFSFLWHRFRRVNPVYYIALLLTIIARLPAIHRHQLPPFTGNDYLASVILFPYPGWTIPILFQAWTLPFEWYYYSVFFLLILFGVHRKGRALGLLLGGMILLGWLLRKVPLGFIGFYMDPYLYEFLLGVAIGYCYRRWTPGKITAWCLLLPGIALGLFWILTGYHDIARGPGFQTPAELRLHAFCWGSSAALIIAGCVFLEKTGETILLFRHPFILLLGDASYSIYLFHMIVLGIIAAVYMRVGFFLTADLAIPIHGILEISGSLLFYKCVEKPLLTVLQKTRSPRPIPSPPVVP